ncbi:hypothetical protein FC15_GL001142 [Lapidilactobacillus concavus DSM 17758]|uniref:Uncharacterized protein n=1 Tax=Lapidilactobacillus concavus DSM 17758 TaxID=1423735 RepID=A0A0R1W6W5_9LACO|nr:hypothetical protein [Lapidilactobacillus concavus]KRM13680.1 hypothetical protein FC15_GL001142 [Lapidilactobacillus concavus DSM 17758]GEL12866.1 hypothetical protein LCO01nite_04150 [Lapidilactobacillus concavus]
MKVKKFDLVMIAFQLMLVAILFFIIMSLVKIVNGQATIETIVSGDREYHNVLLGTFIQSGQIQSVQTTIPFSLNVLVPVILGSSLINGLAINLSLIYAALELPVVIAVIITLIVLRRIQHHQIFTSHSAHLLKKAGVVGLILSLSITILLPAIVHSASQGLINLPMVFHIDYDILIWFAFMIIGEVIGRASNHLAMPENVSDDAREATAIKAELSRN